jgi:hypothetical protein
VSTRVYVHIGLPKTGTTFLQATMWEGRDALAEAGCLVPGERKPSAWWAASDLLGRRPRGSQGRKIPGAWDAVATQLREWTGGRAIFSEELLSIANRRQVRKLVDDLGDSEVHAVVTVRDLGRVLPSLWQQEIRKGRTWTWPEFLASVRDPQQGSVTAAAAFWMRFDLDKVLGAWAAELPPERIHVVVLPAHGSPSSILIERFARAVDLDPALLAAAAPIHRSNPALGADEVEVLRRLNLRLADSLNERQYVRVVVNGVIPALEARTGSTRVQIPAEHRDWLDATSAALVESLRSSSYDVIGDLDDLLPKNADLTVADELQVDPANRDDAALTEPMLDALSAVSSAYAEHWWRRRPPENDTGNDTDGGLGSRMRATTYRAKTRALELAERNRALRWLTVCYLNRRHRR